MLVSNIHPAQKNVLFDHAPCGYHLVDNRGVIVDVNETLLGWLGYDRGQVVGKMSFDDIADIGTDALNDRLKGAKGPSSGVDLTLLRADGTRLPVIINRIDLGNDDSPQLFSTIDNSKCHEAVERMKTLDQELEAFSYSISHDLRAPLRSIDGYSRILQEDYANQLDEEGKRVLNVVMNNARRMGKLIDDLLDFGRLGRKTLQRVPVNMRVMAESVASELQLQYPGRRVTLIIDELPVASADADMMRIVWFNLLENAFKYTGRSSEPVIRVSHVANDRDTVYEVSDNGVGFDMKYSDKLFGVFQRLHRMQDFAGTGVGLAIVKRIISRHGGCVWAEAAVNVGARFYFTLPMEHENE